MRLQNWRRKRGVILTSKGLEKLLESKRQSEAENNFGNRYTFEVMSEQSGLYGGTISKVLNREGGVDKRTIEELFKAFNITLEKSDYTSSNTRSDWGEATSVSIFYGRIEEKSTLEQWILKDRCQLVAILGIGGIGKTSLSIKLAQQIQDNFEYVIWRSLREAPPIEAILTDLIRFLSDGEQVAESHIPEKLSDKVSRLFDYLRSNKCLLILDNMESIMSAKDRAGQYQEGYEGYGELLRRVGEIAHTSCLMLTSREKPKEVALMEGAGLPVRSLQMDGLKVVDGQEIFKIKGLSATGDEWDAIIKHYAGNPLALKIVSTTIQDVFDSNISEFLKQNTIVFGDICDILNQQFERLSDLEKEIVYWLAINREPTSLSELQEDILSSVTPAQLLESLESLTRRSLIEKKVATFTLQPVLMEYVTDKFVTKVCSEIFLNKLVLFRCHALMKAYAREYVRETQVRLILQPVINGLLNIFGSTIHIENQLAKILTTIKETSPLEQSYTAGNILNLLCHLGVNLTGYDFSDLTIWQANLKNVNLHDVNFQSANLAKSLFTETFASIISVTFSPDGKVLAIGDTNGDIRLFLLTPIKELTICKGHTSWVVSVTFSSDGGTLISSSTDRTVKLWNINTGQCLKTFLGHSNGVWAIALSSDNLTLATGSDDSSVRLWSVSTGECERILQGHRGWVRAIAFSPDGHMLASSGNDNTIRFWDISTGECRTILHGHSNGIQSISFSLDGHLLASGSSDRTVKLWDISTGECKTTLHGHSNGIWSVAFSPNGQMLASGAWDRTVKLWDINTGECRTTLHGHTNRVFSVAFSPKNPTLLASGSDDQTVKLWNTLNGECLNTLQGCTNKIFSVAFSSNGQMLASGAWDRTVRLWDINTGECRTTLHGHTNWVYSVIFSRDGYTLFSSSEDRTVKLWNVSNGKCFKTLQGHLDGIWSISLSSNDCILASVSEDRTVKLWDVRTAQCLKTLHGHSDGVWSVAFSPDDRLLATSSMDTTVRLWSVLDGKCLKTLHGHSSWVWSVAFSPNGKVLATSSVDTTVKLWSVSDGKCLKTLHGHTSWVRKVVFSPDGQMLVSSSHDCTVKLWNISTGECLRTWHGHTSWVWSAVFSPDGKAVASSGEDETIQLWNIETGECLKTMRHKKPYENMNIKGVTDLSEASIATLKSLGAVD